MKGKLSHTNIQTSPTGSKDAHCPSPYCLTCEKADVCDALSVSLGSGGIPVMSGWFLMPRFLFSLVLLIKEQMYKETPHLE